MNKIVKWTSDEDKIIFDYYNSHGAKYCSKYLDRTIQAIGTRATRLKINGRYPNWSEDETNFLKKYYLKKDINYCCKNLKRTKRSIQQYAYKLKLTKTEPTYSKKEVQFLYDFYPNKGPQYCAYQLNRPMGSIYTKACILKLKYKNKYISRKYNNQFKKQYIGKQYNQWTILDTLQRGFIAQCKCGHITERSLHNIKRSNGCRKCSNYRSVEARINSYYKRLKSEMTRCKDKDSRYKEISITSDFLIDLFKKQHGRCALSGKEIFVPKNSCDQLSTASLDRIDSKIGYLAHNCQWVHKDMNRIKQHFKQSYFIQMCKEITEYQNTSET